MVSRHVPRTPPVGAVCTGVGPVRPPCGTSAAFVPGLVPVRDSKVPDGPALLLTATAWAPFIGSLK
ncbi:DUF397 domain-containing protein [Streptomyces murinus]